ncbi:hypothetical protein SAMN04487857_10567 [Pseudomonas sp. ok272]|nr:hypothetical protein SAMN04487857_10567 [Pseudomonas sp. ok272]SFM70131.1 hypothetical protein SAMN04487858_105205 [Pseudomonas sp. ok602]
MNTVYLEGVYIGKSKNLGQGLIGNSDKERTCTGRVEDCSSRLPGLALEGLRG